MFLQKLTKILCRKICLSLKSLFFNFTICIIPLFVFCLKFSNSPIHKCETFGIQQIPATIIKSHQLSYKVINYHVKSSTIIESHQLSQNQHSLNAAVSLSTCIQNYTIPQISEFVKFYFHSSLIYNQSTNFYYNNH